MQLRLWCTAPSVDIVSRLCLVTRNGRSTNLTEALTRVDALEGEATIGGADVNPYPIGGSDANAGRLVTVILAPVAAEVGRGEKLRLQVCSLSRPWCACQYVRI